MQVTDLVDSFYFFRWAAVSKLFSLKHPFSASELGTDTALDADGKRVAVEPTTMFFACVVALRMGWSWALCFCHRLCCRAMCLAAEIALGLTAAQAEGQLFLEGRPAPHLAAGWLVLPPYVDNCNSLLWDDLDAQLFGGALEQVLTDWGLAYRVETAAADVWHPIGIALHASARLLCSKPVRAWKVRGAMLALVRQGRATGGVVRVAVGHLIYVIQLRRMYYCVLWQVYRFIYDFENVVTEFD